MNYKMMGRFIGQILTVEGVFMIPAMIVSLCYGEYPAMWSFLIAIAACALVPDLPSSFAQERVRALIAPLEAA